ncbi:MAG: alpha-galactosidase [Victivallales bacterium]|nr:alpha-galactosidase [Victivallales bacterium]
MKRIDNDFILNLLNTIGGENDHAVPTFMYDGEPFSAESWKKTVEMLPSEKRGQNRLKVMYVSPDKKLALEVSLKVTPKYGFVEYTPILRSLSKKGATGIVRDFQSLSFQWVGFNKNIDRLITMQRQLAYVRVRRQYGSQCSLLDFIPDDVTLAPVPQHDTCVMEASQGRSSNDWLPFFGIDVGNDIHFNVAVGWSGAWKAVVKTARGIMSFAIGLQETEFSLQPGEAFELPTVAVQFAAGDDLEKIQNVFRRYVLEYHVPRDARGRVILPPIPMMFSGTVPTEALQGYVKRFQKEGIPLEVFWLDAGWFGRDRDVAWELHDSDWYPNVGDWHVNQTIHPGGLKPVADAVHKAGMKMLLWVEMERAVKKSPIVQQHPEWFIEAGGDNCMLDLGKEEACDYAIETISNLLKNEHIDCYREDFNFDTIPFWREQDKAMGAKGLAEIRFINGFYRFWRTLRRNFPNLLIDNCASGGRRIDWMTISLSIPMWRSDFSCVVSEHNAEANQIAVAYLSRWLPFHASGHMLKPAEVYDYASACVPTTIFNNCDRNWFRSEQDDAETRKLLKDVKQRAALSRRIRDCCLKDFYLLTESPEIMGNMVAVQFDDGDHGVIVACRRPDTKQKVLLLKPRAIKLDGTYELENALSGKKKRLSGQEMRNLVIRLPQPRSAVILFYRLVKD